MSLPFHTHLTDDQLKRGQTIFLDLSQILDGIRNPLSPETHKFIERFRDDMRRILKFKWEAQAQEIKVIKMMKDILWCSKEGFLCVEPFCGADMYTIIVSLINNRMGAKSFLRGAF